MNNSKPYSQLRAMLAVTQASLRSIFRNPSTVAFSFALPVFFILVFGFIGKGNYSVTVALAPQSDTTTEAFSIIRKIPMVKLVTNESAKQIREALNRGEIDGILTLQKGNDSLKPKVKMVFQKSKASAEGGTFAELILSNAINSINLTNAAGIPKAAELTTEEITDPAFKKIDFILPGMLGFSLLSMGVFGTAFVFLNLRNTLVIKRFFATPIHKAYIVLGEALSRVIFALMSSSMIILLGHFAFGFTLQHGVFTFINMLVLAFIALFVFMGMGFIISGVAKNESAVPPLANMIVLPQLILGGTFFPINAFPHWLQLISKALPLTYLNEAMRKVAFEGASLFSVWIDILVLLIWGVIVYIIATRLFKWE